MSLNDSKKFMSLLGKYQTRIHAYILYQVPNRNDAEDILQDTVVVMLNKFSEFKEGSNFLAWGLAIARFKVMSFRQKMKNSRMVFDDSVLDIIDNDGDIQSEIFEHESEKLPECINKLPKKYKTYLQYRYEQSLSYRAIGDKLSISAQAVYKTMNRIHVALFNCVRTGAVKE